jgi:hypothetical protein
MFVGIRYRQAMEFVGSLNLPPKVSNFGIQLPESGDTRGILAMVGGRNPVTSGVVPGFRPVQSESGPV